MIKGPLRSIPSPNQPNNQAFWNLLYYVMEVVTELEKAEQSETERTAEEPEVIEA